MEVKPGYKQTEVGIIPEEWEVESLERISDPMRTICYGIVQVGQFTNNGINVLAIKNLNGDYTTNIHCCSPEIERPYVRSRVRPGDVLVSVKGTIGRVGLVPHHYVGNISRDLARISLTDLNVPEFWHQLLQSEPAQRLLEATTVGTTRMELSIGPLKKVRMPRPTKPEQRAIAEALSDVDALLGGLDRLIAKKRDLKQAAMQQLLTGQTRLPGFQGEWVVKRLGEICDVRDGTHESPLFFKDGIPFITSKNIVDGHLDLENVSFISKSDAVEFNKRSKVDRGDILMSMIGTIGSAVLVDCEPAFCIKNVALIKPREVVPMFLTVLINSPTFQKYLADNLDGGIQKFVSLGTLRQLSTLLPSVPEQTAIAEVLAAMDAELTALEQRREKTRALKQAMMQELLTGRTRLV